MYVKTHLKLRKETLSFEKVLCCKMYFKNPRVVMLSKRCHYKFQCSFLHYFFFKTQAIDAK